MSSKETIAMLDKAVAEQDNMRLLNEFVEHMSSKNIFFSTIRTYKSSMDDDAEEEELTHSMMPTEVTHEILEFLGIDAKLVDKGQREILERERAKQKKRDQRRKESVDVMGTRRRRPVEKNLCRYCKEEYPVTQLSGGLCKSDIGACNRDHDCLDSGAGCGVD